MKNKPLLALLITSAIASASLIGIKASFHDKSLLLAANNSLNGSMEPVAEEVHRLVDNAAQTSFLGGLLVGSLGVLTALTFVKNHSESEFKKSIIKLSQSSAPIEIEQVGEKDEHLR